MDWPCSTRPAALLIMRRKVWLPTANCSFRSLPKQGGAWQESAMVDVCSLVRPSVTSIERMLTMHSTSWLRIPLRLSPSVAKASTKCGALLTAFCLVSHWSFLSLVRLSSRPISHILTWSSNSKHLTRLCRRALNCRLIKIICSALIKTRSDMSTTSPALTTALWWAHISWIRTTRLQSTTTRRNPCPRSL
jgi:hypothetical protein